LDGLDAGAFAVNERGQVAGISTTSATPNATTGIPTVHPFLWERGRMIDLGTLGGTFSGVDGPAILLNNRGQVAGTSTLAGDGINSQGHQIVGRSTPIGSPIQHAFLWEHGGPMVDLNTLIPANSSLVLEEGGNINDRGEIAGRGVPPGCDDVDACGHAFILIP